MLLKDEPHPSSDQAQIPALLEDFRSQKGRVLAQARELERLRQLVRGSAEREAAAIVTAARRNVKQVLLEARRELLVLVAQLQAVGCDAQAADLPKNVLPGETTSASTVAPPSAPGTASQALTASDIVSSARRDVREVLVEAQNELLALAEEARELRARIAKHRELPGDAPSETPAAPAPIPIEEVAYPSEEVEPEPEPEIEPELPSVLQSPAEEISYLSLPSRVWIAAAAGLGFAAVGLGLFMFTGRHGSDGASASRSAAPQTQARRDARPTQSQSHAPAPPPAAAPAPAADKSLVALTMQTKRPAWVRMTVDGRADQGRVYAPGETQKLTAKRDIVMRAGDAGAVLVAVNGGHPRPLGPDGQIVTRRFTIPQEQPPPALAAAVRPAAAQPTPPSAPPSRASTQAQRAPVAEASRPDVGTTGTTDGAPPPATASASDAEREILRSTQRWFEAYFGGDSAGMKDIATHDFSIVDQRADAQRLPATTVGVDRGLQQVRIEVAGDGAVMSARLTERANIDGQRREFVSLVSGVWIKSDGRWKLMGVRFIDPSSIGVVQR